MTEGSHAKITRQPVTNTAGSRTRSVGLHRRARLVRRSRRESAGPGSDRDVTAASGAVDTRPTSVEDPVTGRMLYGEPGLKQACNGRDPQPQRRPAERPVAQGRFNQVERRLGPRTIHSSAVIA